MKRKPFVLMGLAFFLLFAGNAQAAAPKPPANLCLGITSSSPPLLGYVAAVVKSAASVTTADGPTNYYALNGWSVIEGTVMLGTVLLNGTGHMDKNTNGLFHFSVRGTGFGGVAYFNMIYLEGHWNVITKTGNGSARFFGKTGNSIVNDSSSTFNFLEVPCKNVSDPSASLNP